jgi:SPP1 gp7 family putative phage head morphogenesis protein
VAAAQAADVEVQVGQVHMRDIMYEGFSRAMYDIQKSTGLGFGFAGVDTRRLNQILRHNWSGRMFSQRVWHNSNVTARTLAQALTECVMQGKTSRATFDELMEQAQGSRFAANRLLRTETNYISNQATAEAYEQAGITHYRYMAVLDGRTSRICQEKDGNEYPLSEKEVGVNYPPLHPWCRSSVAPVIDGQNLAQMKRWARDPATGEEMKVPRDMSYKEWQKWRADGKPEMDTWRLKYASDHGKINIQTSDGLTITSYSAHILEQMAKRTLTEDDIITAVKEPMDVWPDRFSEKGEPSRRYIGVWTTVNINPDTGVAITAWRTGTKLRKKYGKEG